jgi:hypothetical protein
MSKPEPLSIQAWSWIYVLTGCAMVLAAHWLGVPTDIGAGIIGAGIGAFTQITRLSNTVDHVGTMNVSSDPQKKD